MDSEKKSPIRFIASWLIWIIIFNVILSCRKDKYWTEAYNIVWNTQSKNASESMPVGGCDLGCNVWVENGSLYLYFGRSNSFDENNALLKSGRVKIDFTPNPFVSIRQELKLKNGFIDIEGNNGTLSAKARIWVEVDKPDIHIEISANEKITSKAEYQFWRFDKFPVSSRWVVPSYIDYPGKEIYWYPDTVKIIDDAVIFYHRNNNADLVIDKEIIQQGLLPVKDSLWNPLKDFVFGGALSGQNFKFAGNESGEYLGTKHKSVILISQNPSEKFRLDVSMHSGYYPSGHDWEMKMDSVLKSGNDNLDAAFERHQQWWYAFWEKSYIQLNPAHPDPLDSLWQVGRNYNLFRYQMAFNARGEYPTKFNGGLLTFDPVTLDTAFKADNPDFRAWGGGVMTAQNQRLLYWPLLKTGDFSSMPQQFDFYRRSLKNAELRTRFYWGHKGACFSDQMNQAAIVCGREYGWNRPKDYEPGLQFTPYHEYYFTSQLEFSFMILEYYRYTGYPIDEYIPFIKSAIRFFDEHYRQLAKKNSGQEFTSEGKYSLYPCMALETYSGHVKNPSDVIAALTVLCREMQKMPEKYVTTGEKNEYALMSSRLPEMPQREINGHKTIAPAEQWDRIINVEIPQLYPVFPWGLYGVGKPNLQLAVDTWYYGVDNANQKDYISWHQDAIFCARLGLTREAAAITLKKLGDSPRRFPTFWGPGHDWTPDHNWGGSGMIGLQEMLMQTTDEKIYILPAWPKDWDVDFRLHAPKGTTVEVSYKNGKLIYLTVVPEERRKYVIIMSEK
ncbi:MAG: DUF5703 domain-containing protein [Bacteroidales bacterium]